MAGFEIVGLSLACMLLVVTMLGPFVVIELNPIFGMTVDATPLVLYFFIFATVYNTILVSTLVVQDKKKWLEKEATHHVFSVLVPCRNEEGVVESTVHSLMTTNYPRDKFEVLAIDDGSTDKTGAILEKLALQYPNLHVMQIPSEGAGRGKSEALNSAFRFLMESGQFRNSPDWIVGVIDADGQVDAGVLSKASHSLMDSRTGAVQVLVRISNIKQSILARLQDVEFITFARVTQSARTVFRGAVALGGNGQFIRASALRNVELSKGEYWRFESMTEDLDLGTRVLLAGWENTFLTSVAVYQQGVTTFGALYKQRTRWSWGALQCFIWYILTFKVARARISISKKVDLMYYLTVPLIPPLIIVVWVLSIFALVGLFEVVTPFPAIFLIANSISFFPLIAYGLWSFRTEYPKKYMVPLVFLTTAYTYHWVVCTVAAMSKIFSRARPSWVVTRKQASTYAPEFAGTSAEEELVATDTGKGREQKTL